MVSDLCRPLGLASRYTCTSHYYPLLATLLTLSVLYLIARSTFLTWSVIGLCQTPFYSSSCFIACAAYIQTVLVSRRDQLVLVVAQQTLQDSKSVSRVRDRSYSLPLPQSPHLPAPLHPSPRQQPCVQSVAVVL